VISLRDRLLSKAVINWETGCWEWTANRDPRGYGRITVADSQGKRPLRAHRVSYELACGPIPEGLVIDHLCRVRHCVNPAHLEPVTARENMLRGLAARAVGEAATHCPKGHEYTPENTRTYLSGPQKGRRKCRICIRAQDAGRARSGRRVSVTVETENERLRVEIAALRELIDSHPCFSLKAAI